MIQLGAEHISLLCHTCTVYAKSQTSNGRSGAVALYHPLVEVAGCETLFLNHMKQGYELQQCSLDSFPSYYSQCAAEVQHSSML